MRQRHLLAVLVLTAFLVVSLMVRIASAQEAVLDGGSSTALLDAGALPAPTPAVTPTPPEDTQTLFREVYDAFAHKDWWLLGALGLVGVGFVVNTGLTKKWAFFRRDRVRMAVVAALAAGGALVNAWLANVTPDEATASGAVKMFVAAVFAYMLKKKLEGPDTGAARAQLR
jgi:hypothetical protein